MSGRLRVAAPSPLPYLVAIMKFLAAAKVYIRSGDGGNVVIEVIDGLNTLMDYRYQQHFKAQKGTNGMGKDRHGANGKPIVLKVPVGTQVLDEDRETLIHDFKE